MTTVTWLFRHAGLNRAIVATLLGRGWSIVSGIITIVLVARYLTPAGQGYFYTFSSLIALHVFVELGLTYAIVQFASHEMAELSWEMNGTLGGSPAAKKRLQSLLRMAWRWFGGAGLVLVVVLAPMGPYIAGLDMDPTNARPLGLDWMLLVVLTAANLPLMAAASLLEGCGKVFEVALLRLAQAVAGALALWSALVTTGPLAAMAMQSAAALATGVCWLVLAERRFFQDLLTHRADVAGMHFLREIWPFHWRIAVSWASSYLIGQLFSPLLFATQGAAAAGQMGLSMQIMGTLNGVALAWVSTKAPLYGQLVARGEGAELDRVFRRSLLQSSVVLVALLAGVVGTLWAMNEAASPLAQRMLPWPLMAWLAVAALANHVVFAEAALLRAHRQDPFMALSVVNGVATALMAALLIPDRGLAGAVATYAVAAIGIGLLGGTGIFLRKRKIWWLKA